MSLPQSVPFWTDARIFLQRLRHALISRHVFCQVNCVHTIWPLRTKPHAFFAGSWQQLHSDATIDFTRLCCTEGIACVPGSWHDGAWQKPTQMARLWDGHELDFSRGCPLSSWWPSPISALSILQLFGGACTVALKGEKTRLCSALLGSHVFVNCAQQMEEQDGNVVAQSRLQP